MNKGEIIDKLLAKLATGGASAVNNGWISADDLEARLFGGKGHEENCSIN